MATISTATPPPNVVKLLKKHGFSPSDFLWLAVPSLNPPQKRLNQSELLIHGSVDALEALGSLLGNPTLTHSLRTSDVLVGCDRQCPVCLAAAAFPSKIFTFESLQRLYRHNTFLQMLDVQSHRFGSSGDILDHPQGPEIVEMALRETEGKKHFQIKVYTNYRPGKKDED
ncbi:MAG: hypothetical protein UW68_C0039G0016, partial [Candidatus Collierbacteria bacterium GW2011_GWB1_44_6]